VIIRDVEVPLEILDAIESGTLAIFAGAGVSMGEPAKLPSFWALACSLGKPFDESPRCLGKDQSDNKFFEPLDQFLGRLHHDDKTLRARAASELDPGMKHTELHSHLIKLFKKTSETRIVTTNFDTLFESALSEWQPGWDVGARVYTAPALPLGSDFNGIVHLHGSIVHNESIVLTDRDFGRAYLTEGWARRFLVDLFQSYTVLFVGYSHDDTVVQYLARALPDRSTGKRFVLAGSDEAKERWSALGITPVIYQKSEPNDFSQLYGFTKEIAEQSCLKPSDWKQRINTLARKTPDDLTLAEQKTLLTVLEDLPKIRYFCGSATDAEWLAWLRKNDIFSDLFDTQAKAESTGIWFKWIIDVFAVKHADEVFKLLELSNGTLTHWQWFYIGRLIGTAEIEKPVLIQWIDVIVQTKPEAVDSIPVTWLAEQCSKHEAWDALILLFECLATSRVMLSRMDYREYGYVKNSREIVMETEVYVINDVWENHLIPNLSLLFERIFPLCIRLLERRQNLFSTWLRDYQFDSIARDDIAQGNTGEEANPIDVLINASVLCAEMMSSSRAIKMTGWIEESQSSNSEIVSRIGVHAVEHLEGFTCGEKFIKLKEIGINGESYPSEMYRVLRGLYSSLENETKQEAIDELRFLVNPWDTGDGELNSQVKMNWLTGLKDADPRCPKISKEISRLLEEYPDLLQVANQPLIHKGIGASRSEQPSPFSKEDILSSCDQNHFIEIISARSRGGDARHAKISDELLVAIQEDRPWFKKFVDFMLTHADWKNYSWHQILTRITNRVLNNDLEDLVLAVITQPEVQKLYPHPIANILLVYSKKIEIDDSDSFKFSLDEVAGNIWLNADANTQVHNYSTHVSLQALSSLNYEASLAEYWFNRLKGSDSDEDRLKCFHEIESMLEKDNIKTEITIPTLFSHGSYLCSEYPDWFTGNMLPLLVHEKDSIAGQAWSGLILGGIFNQEIYDSTKSSLMFLMTRYQSVFKEDKKRFIAWIAFMIFEYFDDDSIQWSPLILKNLCVKDRPEFTLQIKKMLKRYDLKIHWHHWLKKYWEDRIENIPNDLGGEEAAQLFSWLPEFDEVFPEAVGVALTMNPHSISREVSISRFEYKGLHKLYPEDMCKVIMYMLKCDCKHFIYYSLDNIISGMNLDLVSGDVKSDLKEALIKMGFKEQELIP
jgi:hypothetical protein